MRTDQVRISAFTIAALLATLTPALAAAPDCTGISAALPADPELVNELTTVQVATGLVLPVHVVTPPGEERMFVVEQQGRIKIVENGSVSATFLDIDPDVRCCGEEGLLSVAFHPDYVTNGHFFVYFTNNSGNQQLNRYTRLTADQADAGSAVTVLTVTHPTYSNHNGGQLAFSPVDGRLYMGLGDGGSGCDPGPGGGHAQNLNTNLGKLLRLDVDSLPYSTDGNPFDGGISGNDEIWAYGLRNPWRFTFDRVDGTLFIGDVGQNAWEEVSCQPSTSTGGENYGWVIYEGDHCGAQNTCGGSCPPNPQDFVQPVREYSNVPGDSVVGGIPYRGCRMPDLHQTYFYAEWSRDFIKSFRYDDTCTVGPDITRTTDLDTPTAAINSIASFGEDARGEILIVDRGGQIHKVLPELSIIETSGVGAPQLLMGDDMTWEDLQASSDHPIDEYRVFRARNSPTGSYGCVGSVDETDCTAGGCSWIGGDLTDPDPGQAFYYLVLAANASGQISSPGQYSDGTVRTVNTLSLCPN